MAETISPWVGVRRPIFPELALSQDDSTLIVPAYFGAAVFLYDVPSLVQRAALTGLSVNPHKAVMSPTGTFAAISSIQAAGAANRILLIDVVTGGLTQDAVGIEMFLADIAITAGGTYALVGLAGYAVVEIASLDVVANVPRGLFPVIATHPTAEVAVAIDSM